MKRLINKYIPNAFLPARGFTLIEILTTMVIVGVLATAAVPIGQLMIIRQQEKNLKEVLLETRKAIDLFYDHYKTYPASFRELRGDAPPNFTICYLRDAPPVNPFTGDQYDWLIITSGVTEYNASGCHEVKCLDFISHNVEVFQFEERVVKILKGKLSSEIQALKTEKIAEGYSDSDSEKIAESEVIGRALQWNDAGKRRTETNDAVQQAIIELKPSLKIFKPDILKPNSKNEYDYYTYWGMWDIRYPREDRLAINETLYKDW